ncbi:Nn.00g030610.m01.CDS01 [Neocucurbitaria sp. VM-36]
MVFNSPKGNGMDNGNKNNHITGKMPGSATVDTSSSDFDDHKLGIPSLPTTTTEQVGKRLPSDLDVETNARYTLGAKHPRIVEGTRSDFANEFSVTTERNEITPYDAPASLSTEDEVQFISSRIVKPVMPEPLPNDSNSKSGLDECNSRPSSRIDVDGAHSLPDQPSIPGGIPTNVEAKSVGMLPRTVVGATSGLRNVIGPVVGFREPRPSPTLHTGFAETGLNRETKVPALSHHLTNMEMVVLRLQHEDLNRRNYTWADYGAIERWVTLEQIFLLNMRLREIQSNKGFIPHLLRDRFARGHIKPVTQWCKKEPQIHIDFWDSPGIIQQLQHFDLARSLSIFDIIALADQVKRCVIERKPLTLLVPPSHVAATLNLDESLQLRPVPALQQANARNLTKPGDTQMSVSSTKPPDKHAPQATHALDQKAQQYSPEGLQAMKPLVHLYPPMIDPSALTRGLQEPTYGKKFRVMRDESNVFRSDDSQLHANTFRDKTNISTSQVPLKRASDLQKPLQKALNLDVASETQEKTAAHKRKGYPEDLTDRDCKRSRKASPPDHLLPECHVDDALAKAHSTAVKDPPSHLATVLGPGTIPHVTGLNDCNDGAGVQYSQAGINDQGSSMDLNKLQPREITDLDYDLQSEPGSLQQHLQVLRGIIYDSSELREEDKQYVPLPPDVGRHELNSRLNEQFCEINSSSGTFFRDLEMPLEDDFSLLARCIRFAKSDAQRDIDWRVHEAHIDGIQARTNPYGMELFGNRVDVDQYDCNGTQQALEVLMGIRFVQHFPHLHLVAADIPDITVWLYCRPRFMLDEVLTVQDKLKYPLVFPAITEFCRRMWPNWKPDLDWDLANGGDLASSSSELIEQYMKDVTAHELDVAVQNMTARTSPPVSPTFVDG